MKISKSCPCCSSRQLIKSPAILMPFISHRIFGVAPLEIISDWKLKTIRTGNTYQMCQSVQCVNCLHLFADLVFNNDEMKLIYCGYRDEEYVNLRNYYEPGYKKQDKYIKVRETYMAEIELFLSPYLKSNKLNILDWGGDTGINTPFKERANLFHVYDINPRNILSDKIKYIDKKTTTNTKYDLIVCSNVLEHIPEPIKTVLDISKAMNKDTILYVEVPLEEIVIKYLNTKNMYINKKYWHEHINFFNDMSLLALFSRCNLNLIYSKRLEVNVRGQIKYFYQIVCKKKTEMVS